MSAAAASAPPAALRGCRAVRDEGRLGSPAAGGVGGFCRAPATGVVGHQLGTERQGWDTVRGAVDRSSQRVPCPSPFRNSSSLSSYLPALFSPLRLISVSHLFTSPSPLSLSTNNLTCEPIFIERSRYLFQIPSCRHAK